MNTPVLALRSPERIAHLHGGGVVFEILGSKGELIVLTLGAPFGKDIPGLRPLATAW
jgi:hypothetical protein